MILDFAEYYYNQVWGCYPFETNDNKRMTQNTVQYLLDAAISETEILLIIEQAPRADGLTPDQLPGWLWEKSLVKRDCFYYHRALHIKPPAPRFDPFSPAPYAQPFYLEMAIRFTLEDLARYFYGTVAFKMELADEKRDIGALQYLLNKYRSIGFVQDLDFVLTLIDWCKYADQCGSVTNVLAITEHENEVYLYLKTKADEAALRKVNRIVWRK